MKKKIRPICSRFIECDKPWGTICRGPKSIPIFTVEVIRPFLQDQGFAENTNFWKKKGKLYNEEKILAYFFSHYPTWQTLGSNF